MLCSFKCLSPQAAESCGRRGSRNQGPDGIRTEDGGGLAGPGQAGVPGQPRESRHPLFFSREAQKDQRALPWALSVPLV